MPMPDVMPVGANTDEKKLKGLYRRQKKIIDLHNLKSQQLSLSDFRVWEAAEFRRLLKKNQFAIHAIRPGVEASMTKEESAEFKDVGLADSSWDNDIGKLDAEKQ